MNATELEILLSIKQRKEAAGHGEHAAINAEGARLLCCSLNTLARKLAKLEPAGNRATKRKSREDRGRCLYTEDQLKLIAGVIAASLNGKDQRMPLGVALEMLAANGRIPRAMHPSQVARQLRSRGLHPEQLALPSASIEMQSLHPGYACQCDATTGQYYFMPGGWLRFMAPDEFYKNKPHNLVEAASDTLTRYTWVDTASGNIYAWHYLGGETAENLLDFVIRCIVKKPCTPMHGVPRILITDPGAAHKSRVFRNFCSALGIDLRHHAPGAARVTGAVEKAHDLIRMNFETRLRFLDPKQVNLDSLNDQLEQWITHFCSTSKHTRHGETRNGAWMRIKPEQLRVPVSEQVLREAARSEPETRRVSNTLTISHRGKEFDVANVPGVVAGLTVTLQINVFRAPAVDILFTCPDTGEQTWHVVEPVVRNEWGYRPESPVWGEQIRAAKHSHIDENKAKLLRQAYRTTEGLPSLEEAARARKRHDQAYAGEFDVMADVKATPLPTYLPRRGNVIDIATPTVELRRLNVVECCKRIKDRLGKQWEPAAMRPAVDRRIEEVGKGGLLETEVDRLAEDLAAQFAPDAKRAAL